MQGNSNRPMGELFSELGTELRTLLQEEMELARTEISEKFSRLLKDVAAVGVGAVLGLVGFLVLVAALVLGLGMFMQLWASALIVGVVFAGAGFFMIQKGRKDIENAKVFVPEKTAEILKETTQWAKAEMK